MKAILFLGTSLLGSQYISEAVTALGYRPIFLLKIEEYSGDPRRAIERCEYYKADVNSLDDILRAINDHQFMKDVIGVTSLLDETLQNACAIAKQFGIAGPDPLLAQLTDKAMVRKFIPEFSPPSLVFTLSNLLDENVRHFFDENNTFDEFVLKPGISSGAVGISILRNTTTADQIRKIINDSRIEGAEQQSWIIQPRIIGRLCSLEGFVRDGEIVFLGFTGRIRKELTEIVAEFPIDNAIPKHLQKKCQEAIKILVRRSGYANGYFHCEFIVNSESAYFIDGNMGRIAGAAIVQQLALTHGKNPVDIYKHVFDLGIFKELNTRDFNYKRVSSEPMFGVNYCISESAKVLNITERCKLTSFHTRIVDNGREIQGVGSSDSAWVGFLVGSKEMVQADIKQLEIETNAGLIPPFYTFEEQQLSTQCKLNTIEGSH